MTASRLVLVVTNYRPARRAARRRRVARKRSTPRVGYLSPSSASALSSRRHEAFRRGLGELGYVVGVTIPQSLQPVVNLKTARALGLRIPQSVLIRADEIIQ